MEQQPSSARIALKWGFLSGIVIIIYSTILNVMDAWQSSVITSIAYLFLGVGIFYAIKEYKTQNNGFVSMGNGLGLGSLLSTVAGLLASIYTYIYMNFVDNTMMAKIIDFQRQKMEDEGMPAEQAEQGMEMVEKFMSSGIFFIITIFIYVFIGFIISLVLSAILKNNKPEMD